MFFRKRVNKQKNIRFIAETDIFFNKATLFNFFKISVNQDRKSVV